MPISRSRATGGKPAVNARDRIGPGPWYNAKNTLIAANVDDLHGDVQRDRNNIQKANALTEKGDLILGAGDKPNQHDILTGSDSDGRALPVSLDASCDGWTSDSDGHKAMLGHADRTGGAECLLEFQSHEPGLLGRQAGRHRRRRPPLLLRAGWLGRRADEQ